MQRMDAGTSRMSSCSPGTVYSSHHHHHGHQPMGVAGAPGGGGYGLFSPGGVISPFCWDTSTFRFDFDDLRAWSNLLSHSSDIRDADEKEVLQRTPEEELERTGPSVGQTGNDDNEDSDGTYEGKRKAGKHQKRKRGTVPVGPETKMKRFKLGVLKNLLTNFSLEKTIEKYRNLSSKPFTVRPGDYSFDCAVSAHQLKDKLFRLTGSDRIKINDRHFVRRMQKILENEDQERMKKADEERAEREHQRLRKLMQHGVISAKELQDDECLVALQASAAAAAAAKSRSTKTQKKSKRTAAHYNEWTPRSELTKMSSVRDSSKSTINSSMTTINRRDQSRNSFRLPAINNHSQSAIAHASFSSLISPSPKRAASHVNKSLADYPSDILSGCTNRPTYHTAARDSKDKTTKLHYQSEREDRCMTAEEERRSSSLPAVRISPAAGSDTKYEHPLIQKMRREKTVKGIYELAAKLSTMSF